MQHDVLHGLLGESCDSVESETDSVGLKMSFNTTELNIDCQHADTIAFCILNQLGRRIKPKWLCIKQGSQKGIGMVMLHPAADIDQQRKAGGMGLWKSVFAKALNLPKYPICKFTGIAAGQHAVNDSVIELPKAAFTAPCRHRAAQLVGLAGAKACCKNRQLHDLLLKDRHTKCARECFADCGAGIFHWLKPLTSAQIGVHHAALNRSRTHDGHLNDQIVKASWL